MRWWPLCFILIFFSSCQGQSGSQRSNVRIKLSRDSQMVLVSGLEYSVLQEMKKDSLTPENWQGILPVYRMPADTEMKDLQKEQPGVYHITDSLLAFKPDTAFKKGERYFARFYGDGSNFNTTNLIRSKSNLKGQNFIEVVFKF